MHFSTDGFDTLFIFAVAIAAFAIPDVLGGNGYLSAYIVGVMLGNEEFKGKKSLVVFFDGLTGLMQVLIFFSMSGKAISTTATAKTPYMHQKVRL